MNAMKRRFRKCCTRSHAGKPSVTARADQGTPGYRTRKSCTAGKLPHCLGYGDADDGEHKTDSARPTAH